MRLLVSSTVLFLAVNAMPSSAQPLVIDDFSTSHPTLILDSGDVGSSVSSHVTGLGILGSERGLQITLDSGTGVNSGVGSGSFFYDQGFSSTASGQLQWDGADATITLDPIGLGGVDLSAAGRHDAVVLGYLSTDMPIIGLTVYTDAANSSVAAITLPATLGMTVDYSVPFASFAPSLGAGADFSNVGAITLELSSMDSPELTIDQITTESLLNASMTDALLVDNGNGIVDPGETVRYSVSVVNPDDAGDAAVSGVDFSVAPDANTALVVGSVTTTQGSVIMGNAAGQTSVSVDLGTLNDGDTATVTFDVMVSDPFPMGEMSFQAQGTLSSDSATFATDDPDEPGFADPTVTTSMALPVTLESFLVE